MTDPAASGAPLRFIAGEFTGRRSSLADMVATLGIEDDDDFDSMMANRRERMQHHAAEIVRLTAAYDPFDVIELMRRLEFGIPGSPASSGEPLLARVEIVAQLMTEDSRDGGSVSETAPSATMIRDVQRHAYAIMLLHTFGLISDSESTQYGPLTPLAATYATYQTNVRHMQYSKIRDYVERELFSAETIVEAMRATVGFSYEEFRAVRQSIANVYDARYRASTMQRTDGFMASLTARRPHRPATDVIERPGWIASFTADDICRDSHLDLEIVEAVIGMFSLRLDRSDVSASARLQHFIDGDSPHQDRSLVANADGRFISLPSEIGDDSLRSIVEDSLKRSPFWSRYDRHRKNVTESIAVNVMADILNTPATYTSLEYLKPASGVGIDALGPDAELSAGFHGVADQTEADALFVIDDVAICVEVKAPAISPQARRGNVKRLTSDLEKTVGSATSQTTRLQDLLAANGGLWQPDGTWIDLSDLREIRSVAVFLDDLGPLSIAANHLQAAGLLPGTRIPYLVTMHDLIVMSTVFDHPSEFLLFIRRRTDSPITAAIDAVDELDVLMLFLTGQLYADPDPDQISIDYPYLDAPTPTSRANYSRGTVRTMIDSQTDALDAWIQPTLLGEPPSVDKPRLPRVDAVGELTNLLYRSRLPGWFRFSADLLNLSTPSQKFLRQKMKRLVRKSRRDKEPHTLALPMPGAWGFPTLFVASSPTTQTNADTAEYLRMYMRVKKHQMRSDRALGIVLTRSHGIASVCYDNNPIADDPELDQWISASGLTPGRGQRPHRDDRDSEE